MKKKNKTASGLHLWLINEHFWITTRKQDILMAAKKVRPLLADSTFGPEFKAIKYHGTIDS